MTEIAAGLVLQGFEFLERLSESGCSSTWKVKSQQYERLFIAKIAKVRDGDIDRSWSVFDREVQALLRLDHPHVVSLYGHFRHANNFVMIIEFLPNGSLDDYLSSRGPMDASLSMQLIKQICSALSYCWSRGVCHRDLKPSNIMFDQSGRAKLVDFGISAMKKDAVEGSIRVGEFTCSVACAAPEVIKNSECDPVKVDMWAMGITIVWMANGSMPWRANNVQTLVNCIKFGQCVVPKEMDPEVGQMVRRMLAKSPKDRAFPSNEELERLGRASALAKPKIQRNNVLRGNPTSMRVPGPKSQPVRPVVKVVKAHSPGRFAVSKSSPTIPVDSGTPPPKGKVAVANSNLGNIPLSPLAEEPSDA